MVIKCFKLPKNEVQRAELSKINEEQAKFEGLDHILPERVKELILERLKTKPKEVEFAPIYLVKKTKLWHAWSGVFL